MILTWMAYSILLGGILAVAAEGLQRVARLFGRPSRFIWMTAMPLTALVPVIGYFLVRRAALSSMLSLRLQPVVPAEALPSDQISLRLAEPTWSQRMIGSWNHLTTGTDRVALILWGALTFGLFVRLVIAMASLIRRRSHWREAVVNDVPVRVTADIGPAVVSMPKTEILLPEWVMSLEAAEIETIVRHEREHREAGDARLLLASALMTALVPWNVALWLQRRRLRLAVELDCDARVLRAGSRVDRYGSLLLAIAQHPRSSLFAAATLAESTSDLERRIHAMTAPKPSSPRRAALLPVVGALLAIGFACATPAPDVVVGPSGLREVPVHDFKVSVQAHPADGNPSPEYPAQLRAANIEGSVVIKIVIDTTGRANIGSLIVQKSDHDLFTAAVRNVLPKMTFVPAEMGGRKVQQLITMPFVFSLSSERPGTLTEVPVVARQVTGRASATKPPKLPNGDDTQATLFDSAAVAGAGREGTVTVRFNLLSDGAPDMNTFTTVRTDDQHFIEPARKVIATQHFTRYFDGKSSLQMSVVFRRPTAFMLAFDHATPRERDSMMAARFPARPAITMKPGSIPAEERPVAVTKKAAERFDQATSFIESPVAPPRMVVHRVTDTIPPASLPDNPPPTYPNQLRAANIEGQVILQFVIREDGSVDGKTVEVLKSDHALFTNAAVSAVLQYRFKPAAVQGKPVSWLTDFPFLFNLSK